MIKIVIRFGLLLINVNQIYCEHYHHHQRQHHQLVQMQLQQQQQQQHLPQHPQHEQIQSLTQTDNLYCYVCSTIEQPECRNLQLLAGKTDSTNANLNSNSGNYYINHTSISNLIGGGGGGTSTSISSSSSSISSGVGDGDGSDDVSNRMMASSSICINGTNGRSQEIAKRECQSDQKFCLVTKIEYITGDNQKRIFWGLDRSCSKTCMSGCIIIGFFSGERTRLELCQSCCTSNLCNISNLSTSQMIINTKLHFYQLLSTAFIALLPMLCVQRL